MKSVMTAAILGLIAAGVSGAEPPDAEPGKRRGGPPREKRDFFDHMLRLDEDRNGAISFAEFSKAERVSRLTAEEQRRLFDRLDKNKDGEIRRDEISRGGLNPRPGGGMRGGSPDLDGDKKVSLEEFRQNPRMAGVPAERLEEIFRRMDRNRDGFLTGEDFRGRRPERPGGGPRPPHGPFRDPKAFKELDTDDNGSLSFEEFRIGPRVKEMDEDRQEDLFEKMDRDGDGTLRKDELLMPGRGPAMGPGHRGPDRPGKGPKPRRGEGRPEKPAAP